MRWPFMSGDEGKMADNNDLASKGAEYLKNNSAPTAGVDAGEYDGDTNNIGKGELDEDDNVQEPEEDADEGVDAGDDDDAEGDDEEDGEELASDEDEDEDEEIEEADPDAEEDEDGEELEVVDDSELEFADHPRFVDLLEGEQQLLALQSVINDVRVPFADPADPEKCTAELKARLGDADVLYDILSGKPALELLLVTASKQQGGMDVLGSVIQQFEDFKAKYAEELRKAGIEVNTGAEFDSDDEADPAMREIKKLRAQITKMQQGGGTRQAGGGDDAAKRAEVFTKFDTRVKSLAKKYGYDEGEAQEFVDEIAQKIGKSPLASAIRQRVAQGKFVDIDKFFFTRHSAIELRVTKRSKSKLAVASSKAKKFGTKKKSTSGKEPAAVQAPKPLTREERVAAGTRYLQGKK
jgi:hypothetical protein